MENVLAETNAYILHITDANDISGLPADIVTAAKEKPSPRNLDGWVFTLQYPSFGPVFNMPTTANFAAKYTWLSVHAECHGMQTITVKFLSELLRFVWKKQIY
jgi:Zn-dependent oligopeptidase